MVEPVSLTVGAVVAALLTKAAEKGGENLADAAKTAVGRLIRWLRDRFTQSGDEEGLRALAWAEGAPDSPSRMGALADVVDRRAEADSEFKSQVQHLVDDAQHQRDLPPRSIAQSGVGRSKRSGCRESGYVGDRGLWIVVAAAWAALIPIEGWEHDGA